MFRSCKSTSSCLVINTLCVYPFYITCQNHKRITQFCFICRGSLVHFMRNRIEHLQSPGAPTQNTHTHLSHTANCTNSNGTHAFSNRKNTSRTSSRRSRSSHLLSLARRQLQRWNSQRLCLRRFFAKAERKHFLLKLTFLLSAANLMNILYGFYMDLFFLFSYSVPEVPWPRSPVSLMTVGEQSISCTPPNIAQHPLRAVD